MDVNTAQSIIQTETENESGFLYRFTVYNTFLSENWQQLQTAIRVYADSITDDDLMLDRRTVGDLHYLTEVLTIANEVLQSQGEINPPLEAAISALWEYNQKIFTVPENRKRPVHRKKEDRK